MKSKGFTLIEIMVSLAIIAAGFLSLFYIYPLGAKIEKQSQMTTEALEIGQAKIEEVSSRAYADIVSSVEEYGTMANSPAFKRTVTADFYDPVTGGIAANDTGIKKVTVQIFWNSSLSGEKNISLKSLISQR